ncbi:MAG: hypothetical protein M3463_17285, partial [Verrucomicrobiota bacterium]|nr:hypothetical protein [Verrucomicrobiota bacterium]
MVSASGRKLGGGDVEAAWKRFCALPESERAPGAVKVQEHGRVDTAIVPPDPPAGALVLKIFGRILTREPDGTLRYARASDCPLMRADEEKYLQHHSWIFEAHP